MLDLSSIPDRNLQEALSNYILHAHHPGDFLEAVLRDRFMNVFKFGDEKSLKALQPLAQFIYADMPIAMRDFDAWRGASPEARQDVLKAKGWA